MVVITFAHYDDSSANDKARKKRAHVAWNLRLFSLLFPRLSLLKIIAITKQFSKPPPPFKQGQRVEVICPKHIFLFKGVRGGGMITGWRWNHIKVVFPISNGLRKWMQRDRNWLSMMKFIKYKRLKKSRPCSKLYCFPPVDLHSLILLLWYGHSTVPYFYFSVTWLRLSEHPRCYLKSNERETLKYCSQFHFGVMTQAGFSKRNKLLFCLLFCFR